jgi:ribose 5-phosphate isomerase B
MTMRIGFAADHEGFELKEKLIKAFRDPAFEIVDFGALTLIPGDDYPDFVIPLARAVAQGEVQRGVAICGSGVGASVAANKVPRVRAALIAHVFAARQGVEDDDMNVICLGARLVGYDLARDLVRTFLGARFSEAPRHQRRLAKIKALEGTKDLR